MTYKKERELLQQVADYTNVPEVARAAEMGVQALEKVERLEKQTERHDELVRKLRGTVSESKRQMLDDAADAIESLEAELAEAERRAKDRDGLFARLIDDLKLVAKEGGTPCGLCRWAYAPLPCRDGPPTTPARSASAAAACATAAGTMTSGCGAECRR